MLSRVDPRNHVLYEVQIPIGRGNFEEEGHAPDMPDDNDADCAK